MARATIPPGISRKQAAAELKKIGITLGQQLQDGSYRVYVRKDHRHQFLAAIDERP